MKKISSLLSFLLLLLLFSGSRPVTHFPVSGSYLGFNLMSGPNSGLITYAIVTPLSGGKIDARFISRNEFIRLAAGITASEANLNKENLFTKFEVEDCGVYRDSIFKRNSFSCSSVDQLWKLRYKVGPYLHGPDTLGWTNATVPSMGQMSILRTYGIDRLDDFFYGDNAFKLLHDMQSYAWQSRYRGS